MGDSLNDIYAESWNKLTSHKEQAEASFKYMQVCHYAEAYVEAYTVVLREAIAETSTLVFYTDTRSPKVKYINDNNRLTIVCYSDTDKLQLTLKGEASIYCQDETTLHYWKKDGYKGRRSYLAQPAPSTIVDEPTDGLDHISGVDFDDKDVTGYENFAVVKIALKHLEYLQLSRNGNRRANFSLNDSGSWQSAWLVP